MVGERREDIIAGMSKRKGGGVEVDGSKILYLQCSLYQLNARSKYRTQLAKMSFDEILDLKAVVVYFNFVSEVMGHISPGNKKRSNPACWRQSAD